MRAFYLCLVLLLIASLAACSGEGDNKQASPDGGRPADTADTVQGDGSQPPGDADVLVPDAPEEPPGDAEVQPLPDIPDGFVPPPDADGGGGSGDAPEAGDLLDEEQAVISEFGIMIAAPQTDTSRSGSIDVLIVPLEVDELEVDKLTVWLGDIPAFADTKLPTRFVLDTTEYDNGPLDIKAVAEVGDLVAEHQVKVILENASFRFKNVHSDEYVYGNGDQVSIFVSTGKPGMEFAAGFAAMDSGYAEGAEEVYEIGGGKYMLSYTISADNTRPDGWYQVPLSATDGEFTLDYPHVEVGLKNLALIPIRVEGGIFVPGLIPAPDPGWEQPIELVYGNEFVITGGSAKVNVDFSGYTYPKEIVGIIIGMEGYSGYYQRPLEGSFGDEELLLLLKVYIEGEQSPNKLPLRIAVRDVMGRVSEAKPYELSVQSVGSGDIQVSVSWDTPTDVDLHVVEPNGCEIYYGNEECPSGGWLDLDSNPACFNDNINNENIYWPDGQAPEGTYIVRVDFYDDCCYCGAQYTVTIHYCGDMEIYEGSFNPGTDDSGGEGDGVTVATFSNGNCGRVLRGRVRYEDKSFDRNGFAGSTWKPVRHATVEVHRAEDAELLATGWTDRFGNYEIQFSNKQEPGIYLVVRSETNIDEGLRKLTVMNHPKFKVVYSVSSASIDETLEEFPVLDFDIPEVVGAGAFNIMDVLIAGYDLIRLMTGKDLGWLHSYWATGADTTDTLYCSQYFYDLGICTEKSALSVQGKDIDRDEYDDMVILKEFFKFALEQVALDDNPGGGSDGTRDDPRRAWSEGVSAFFACDVLDYPHFVNSGPWGVYHVHDLEGMDSPFSFSTANGAQSGPVSEYLVSASLWDFRDAASDDEPFDTVHNMPLGIYDAVFNYLPTFHYVDRGFAGVDFVDFLDGWFCRGWGDEESVTSVILGHRDFPYDFGGPELCIH